GRRGWGRRRPRLERSPLHVAGRALDGALDEAHAARAVLDRRVVAGRVLAPLAAEDGVGDLGVDVRERLEERLGVAGGQPRGALRRLAQVRVAAPEQPDRAVERREPQVVRVLLAPGERALLAVDLQHEVVLVADLDLRGDEHALGAAL